MTTTMMRLREAATGRSLLVDRASGRAFADQDGDGRIAPSERLSGQEAERALQAAAEIDRLFVKPVPGTTTPDAAFEVRGAASRPEAEAFARGEPIAAEREALKLHLDFFDQDGDGRLSVSESYRGFRDAGFKPVSAGFKAFMAGVIFGGVRSGLTVDVEAISAGKRYASSTGIYDAQGRIDEAKLGEYLRAFDDEGGRLSFDEVMALLSSKSATGTVSRNQFKSLFTVCARLNGGDFVTREQFRGLFDGSLLYLAASRPDDEGHRRMR